MFKRFAPVLALTAACWLVFVVNNLGWHGQLNQYGITPRRLASLPAVVWAPFLHESFSHLAANTLPLLILGGILCLRSKTEFATVAIFGTLLGGGLTWVFARPASHIGASGLVFCFFGYLASLACFRRTFGTLALSVLCIVGYGGLIKGVLPTAAAVSWEGHLAGLITGVALAWMEARFGEAEARPNNISPQTASKG